MPEKKVGRPRGFDREQALNAAVTVFWEKGYDGTSMRDLTDAMGINSPSLYSVFGDKQQLFMAAIDHYSQNFGKSPISAFNDETDIKKAIIAFLETGITEDDSTPEHPKGCFISSCVPTSAGHVEGATEKLQHIIKGADSLFAARFEEEKSRGSLPADFPSEERARLMFDLRQGHVLRARADLPSARIEADLESRANMILSY
ncbi:TetR/AcrR family transcriptional regulator [Kordiimonas laminariae]|uniref:TetR/AcrR family transcriptional regulator n=1 Tax=Kordiimonas laminariae TaxID=2917717 RepID=UPI001FF22108|nr:TetR/AcrR family transcriptional regulator [Kordiimonas laminariae]MCK0068113.1 TetR/AcrR family transcriptional regulator [Kordiimonas laminariae]